MEPCFACPWGFFLRVTLPWCFSSWRVIQHLLQGLIKHELLGSTSRTSDSRGLEQDLKTSPSPAHFWGGNRPRGAQRGRTVPLGNWSTGAVVHRLSYQSVISEESFSLHDSYYPSLQNGNNMPTLSRYWQDQMKICERMLPTVQIPGFMINRVFLGCCNKLPHAGWPQTTDINLLIVSEARSWNQGVKQGYPLSLAFAGCWHPWCSLTYSGITPFSASVITWLFFSACVSSLRTAAMLGQGSPCSMTSC